ncbi:MAG: VOC family protein [Ruthenibacterium sp.]
MELSIHHVAIITGDYAASRHFYVELLCLPIVRENYRAARDSWKLDLQLGDAELEIFSMKNPPARLTQPEAAGLRHLAFYVDSVADAVAELAQKGIVCEPVRRDEYSNKPFTFFFDPDGLPLELHE